jgi:hypothetical protein
MKKLLVFLAVLAMALSTFAAITTTGPNISVAIRGSATFGLFFDENGLDLYLNNAGQYKSFHGYKVTVVAAAEDGEASLNVNFSGSHGTGNTWTSLSFNSAIYDDNLVNVGFYNYGYGKNFSSNYLSNWFDAWGNLASPRIGTKYLETTVKSLPGLEILYITLNDAALTMHSNVKASGFLAADVFAAKYPLDLGILSGNVSGALWAAGTDADKVSRGNITLDAANTDGEHVGFAAEAIMSGNDALAGLNATLMLGMHDTKTAFHAAAVYAKTMELSEMISGKLHAEARVRDGLNDLPFTRHGHSSISDTAYINGGLDATIDLNNAGTISVYDKITFAFDSADGVSPLSFYYGAKYVNSASPTANIMADVRKFNATDVAAPLGLNVKVNGAMNQEMFDFSYLVEIADVWGPYGHFVLFDNLNDLTVKYFAYEAKFVVRPMDKTTVTARLFNWLKNSDGLYTTISGIADLAYTVDAAYKPNSIVTLGAHVDNENNFGDLADIHWYLSAFARFAF